MRTHVYSFVLATTVGLSACAWTSFDDLANTMWVQSTQKPDVGSSDYGVAIVGATKATTGARLVVISNDVANYSTLNYDQGGGTSLGPTDQKLGVHFITSLDDQPIVVTDGAGKVALVNPAIDAGNIAVYTGDADQPADAPFASSMPPDDAAWVTFPATSLTPNTEMLVIAAGPNLFLLDGTNSARSCAVAQDTAATPTPLSAAAIAADDTQLWVWTKGGAVLAYDLTVLSACAPPPVMPPTPPTPPGPAPTPSRLGFTTGTFMPSTGARIYISGATADPNQAAVLAGHDTMAKGQVTSIKLAGAMPTMASSLSLDGLRSSAFGPLGAAGDGTFVALGFPNRAINGTTTGQVELYTFDPASALLSTAPVELLNDAQPDNNELFGRALANLQFDGKNILVVAASNEIFSYFRTTQYADTRP